MARGLSRESAVRLGRALPQRHWRDLLDAALLDRRLHMVARDRTLASKPLREFQIGCRATPLGPAQRARVLVFFIRSAVGNLRNVLLLSSAIQRDL